MSTALLFSGQGSQYSGMGSGIISGNESAYVRIFEAGSDILGFDVKAVMLGGSAEELAQTKVSQPAIFTMSLLCLEKYRLDGGSYEAVAGHSLGEYAAMVAAEMVDMETGYTLIKHRAACMEKAAVKNGGKMAAVLFSDTAAIESVCREVTDGGDYVVPVNYNSAQQTVIAGSESGIEKASERLKAAGAKRIVPLAVAAAFHSEYMKEAGLEFKELIKDIEIGEPKKAFYSNLSGGRLADVSDIHDMLSKHIFSPVRFTDELRAMQTDGVTAFTECGPGKTLTGLVKKTLDGVEANAMDS